MKISISLLCMLLLVGCQPKEATDFEGSITYKLVSWEPGDMDSAKAADTRAYYPIDTMIVYIDEGRFLTKILSYRKDAVYNYFDPHMNKEFVKFSDTDTLFVSRGEKKPSWDTPLLDVIQKYNTDTILGHVCHSLIFRRKDYTSTYTYSPDLPTNPQWYQRTKMNSMDLKYKLMKAYYLAERHESKEFNYTIRAVRITSGKVSDSIFPKVENIPQRYLED